MMYKLEIFNREEDLFDVRRIDATGKRLAILKYLRRFPNNMRLIKIKITSEEGLINYYMIKKTFSDRGKFVEINKIGG